LPIERDYIEAVSHSAANPDLAVARLRAILDVYAEPAGKDRDRQRQVLQLAERQVRQLNEQARGQAPAYLEIIDRRLAHADEIKGESPNEAARIWQSIVVLYGDKPWAAERVQQARAALVDAEKAQSHN
jgi:eukaryotic-like serine/threonine-protein kinase